MRKIILLISVGIIIAGCATPQRSSELAKRTGVKFDAIDNRKIEEIAFKKPATKADANLVGYCLASNMNADSVQLTDSSKSFVGQYTGNYYNIESKGSTSAEQTIKYISNDGLKSVSAGQVDYIIPNWAATIKTYLRFSLDLEQGKDNNTYTFKNFKTAQQNTGSLANNGFSSNFWDIDQLVPERGYDKIEALANTLNQCLSKAGG